MKPNTYPTDETSKRLNEQIQKENQAAHTYLNMATWADINAYKGTATFLYQQAQEEREHMMKIIHYLIEMEQQPIIPVAKPIPFQCSSLKNLFQQALQQEIEVTQSIYQLVEHCLAQKDFGTQHFLQWFVQEQKAEEATIRKILEYFQIIELTGVGLYTIDQEVGKLTQ